MIEKLKIDNENLESIKKTAGELKSEIEVKIEQISEEFEEEQT